MKVISLFLKKLQACSIPVADFQRVLECLHVVGYPRDSVMSICLHGYTEGTDQAVTMVDRQSRLVLVQAIHDAQVFVMTKRRDRFKALVETDQLPERFHNPDETQLLADLNCLSIALADSWVDNVPVFFGIQEMRNLQ